jgi:DNA-binding transcriptional ArsR family regulator
MVVREQAEVDRVFRALSDPTRRDILRRTMQREHSVSELADRYPMTFAAVQRHVAVLDDAGLVTKRAAHRHRYVRGNPHALDAASAALAQLRDEWVDRLDRFEAELAEDDD